MTSQSSRRHQVYIGIRKVSKLGKIFQRISPRILDKNVLPVYKSSIVRYQSRPEGASSISSRKEFLMTSRAAPLFTVAATEAANDPLQNAIQPNIPGSNTDSHAPRISLIIVPATGGIGNSANDSRDDPRQEIIFAAKRYFTEVLRLARTIDRHRLATREPLGPFLDQYRWTFSKLLFWETVLEEIRTSTVPDTDTPGKSHRESIAVLAGERIRFIAEECWNALLIGNTDPRDIVRLLRAKRSFTEWYATKSDHSIVADIFGGTPSESPWKFLAALSTLADRETSLTMRRFPHPLP